VPFKHILKVANPSPYERSDYVEIDDLDALGVPSALDDANLQLIRQLPQGPREEVAFQIDHPFGRRAGYRTLTFFSSNTPPGDPDYRQHTAEFSLEEGTPHDVSSAVSPDILNVEHYSAPGVHQETWDPAIDVAGVELANGPDGLQVYFSLVPRPQPQSPFNYSGAVTSIQQQRASHMTGAGEFLAPYHVSPQKCWGQLTRLDFFPLPWERRCYQEESLLGQAGNEPRYTLVWSKAGPLRATVTLKSEPIKVQYVFEPFFKPDVKELTCHLYRIISMYPNKEFYAEQLIVRPGGEGLDPRRRFSLAFRAHYYSHLAYPEECPHQLARSEQIPDYFAVWKSFAVQHRGFTFASDSHVRALKVTPSEIRWRLQFGHEHRCVHLFPFHCWPEEGLAPSHEVGHTAWYERLWKPLQALPLNRYQAP